jgi:nucleoid-associated protein YgaU
MSGSKPISPTEDSVNPADLDPVIRAVAAENAVLLQRLRGTQIPQHIGMAAACRALAVELPRALAAQIEADLQSGDLAQRWEAARAATAVPGASGEFDSTLTAVAVMLRELGRVVMRHLIRRDKEWSADAYRLEGQAVALEAVNERLHRAGHHASDAKISGPADLAADPTANGR